LSALRSDAGARARVLIAGDQRAMRTGVRLALANAADCTEFEQADDAVEAAVRDRPDVVFVDFTPASRGIRATAEITAGRPDATVIVMTRSLDEDEFVRAVRAGAAGYIAESVDPERLPHVMHSLMRGEAVVPRMLVARLIEELRGRDRRRHHLELREHRRVELTPREWEVLELLRQGLTTRMIAEQLGISAVTVRRHIGTVHQKAGTTSRGELLRLIEGEWKTGQ
jgi:DNA-binding NarL/FixJ family response regulator